MEWLSDEFVQVFEDTLCIGSFDTRIVFRSELRYWDESFDPIKIDEKSSLVGFVWYDSDDLLRIEVRMELLDELGLACLTK